MGSSVGKNRAISKKRTLFDVEKCEEAFQKTCLSFGGSLEGSNWCTAGGERKGTGSPLPFFENWKKSD